MKNPDDNDIVLGVCLGLMLGVIGFLLVGSCVAATIPRPSASSAWRTYQEAKIDEAAQAAKKDLEGR